MNVNFIATAIIGGVIIFGGMYFAKKVLYTDGDLPCFRYECKEDKNG